jgi:hypothetical protein
MSAGADAVYLSWVPIVYTGDTGGYRIFYSRNPQGPWTFFKQTANKAITSMKVTGLAPRTRYYFVISTRTDPHGNQQNLIDSDYSRVVSATTAGKK